ncbi:hypothetical protein R1flu_018349 [Riccia fluitans]|uniref:Uncharacterized protein n=1 Tax=Riccia fluitans TaxID=41844 RepID=A0ABD1ZFK6_9MARC
MSGLHQQGDRTHTTPGREAMSAVSSKLNATTRRVVGRLCWNGLYLKQLALPLQFRGGPLPVIEYMEELLTNSAAGF